MEQELTAGARRALDRAADLAAGDASETVRATHLLWALLEEESHASEILSQHDIDTSVLERELPICRTLLSAPTHPKESLELRQIVREARRQAGLVGRHVEVGSEHLLGGLGTVESEVSPLLTRHGLAADVVAEKASEVSGFSTAPLATDIEWQPRVELESERVETYRILDAATNRFREGLRVVEDFTRFALDDAHLTSRLKALRHTLTAALRPLGPNQWVASRETQHDVGTQISTVAERARSTPLDVVRANLKRVQESARTLEEYSKVVAPDVSAEIEQIRYTAYTLERAVLAAAENHALLTGRELYLLVTEAACHHGSGPAIRAAVAAGAGIVQIREKDLPDRTLLAHGKRVREWTREGGALLIMNDRPDLALLVDADGVHLGQDDMNVREARRILGPNRLIGVSTHSLAQAQQAVLDGADYLGVGPCFSSRTKSFDSLAGLEFVKQVAAEISLPWYAIGGINANTIGEAVQAGVKRVAVSHAVCAAEDPGAAAAQLIAALHSSSQGAD